LEIAFVIPRPFIFSWNFFDVKTMYAAGTLPKPIIWAQPSSITAYHKPVAIWCQGSWDATEYHLHKDGSLNPWDRQLPLERENKTKFYIQYMSEDYAGLYKCYYKSNLGLSEHSDTLELVLTGVFVKPSLSVWPSPVLIPGETVTLQCSSSLGFGRFILIQKGKKNLAWTLDSQTNGSRKFQAHFVLDSVTINHNVSDYNDSSFDSSDSAIQETELVMTVGNKKSQSTNELLLCLGLNVGHKTSVLAGTLPKPIIWAQPSSMTVLHKPVTIWCQGSWDAMEYHLHKEGSINPWDRQLPLERENKTKFYIQYMSEHYAGLYKCYYKSNLGLSEHSDTLELVLTGGYDKPSLSVWPSPVLTLGESVTMQCSSSLGFGRFILIQKGKKNLSWTLDSQTNGSRKFQAHFVLDSVTINHNATFRCYGYFRNRPQMWSSSSDSIDLLVSDYNLSSRQLEMTLDSFKGNLISPLMRYHFFLLLTMFLV
ncbi:Leukocyte immunoglobulin-like receptor subfamily A member 6, partial [Sigmodon hispidus]